MRECVKLGDNDRCSRAVTLQLPSH